MRSDSGNPLTTLVMFIPLVAVPALAIFGVPDWFSKAAASTSGQTDGAPDFQLKLNPHSPDVAPPATQAASHEHLDGHSQGRHSNSSASSLGNDEWEPPNWDQGSNQAGAANQPLSTGSDPFETAPRRSTSNGQLSDEFATTQSSQQNDFEFDRGEHEHENKMPIDLDSRHSPFVETSGQEDGSETSQGVEFASAESSDDLGEFFADNFDQSDNSSDKPIDGNPFGDTSTTSETQDREPRRYADRSEQQTLESALNEFDSGRNNGNDDFDSQTQPTRKSSQPALNWQNAIEALNAAGVYEFALKKSRNTSGYIFRCVYREAGKDDIFFRFEAEAAKPLDAVNDVVGQVVRWSRQQ